MNEIVSKQCYDAADKILVILDGLKYTSERKPAYDGELRDLIAIEVRRNVNDVVTGFYNSVAVEPIK